ncbi:hypothetical protein [Cytobacillus massiliigabonensis]|uniref:hypothetical protein n=1 Tax=Cytobacillus massiliigabonensis TaxID=1871011 RepID=UPI000C8206A0|nr:hypothetical protein [Cytobacillus massiliigabonensis]
MTFALAMLIVPWLTVPFMRKKSFFRFLPLASFTNLFISVFSLIANKKKWWENKNPLSPGPIDFTYILGLYFVATLWIFKLTYGNFSKYLITNIVLDGISSNPFSQLWEKAGVFKFKKINHTIWYFICVSLAIIIYGYQYIVEKSINKNQDAVLRDTLE